MTKPISRFFAPVVDKSLNGRDSSKSRKEPRVKLQKDGWQIPLGLTSENAIEIVDSDDEKKVPILPPKSASIRKNLRSKAKVLDSFDGLEDLKKDQFNADVSSAPRFSNAQIEGRAKSKFLSPKSYPAIYLCSPGPAFRTNDKRSYVAEETKLELITSESNDEISTKSTNPFLQFAHDLGNPESSYITETVASSTVRKAPYTKVNISGSRKETQKVPKSKGASTSSDASVNNKKRKRTFSKVDESEFSKKTSEELSECRKKWQSFADHDAPLEIRRFQVLIAARVHCQAHDQTVRKVMAALRDHFRKPDQNMGVGNGSKCGDCSDQYQFLSPETLRSADEAEVSKIISSVLFANVKSKQIIQAAREIKYQFGGKVPESKASLKSIIGIGPKLAELLHHVNSYNAYANVV